MKNWIISSCLGLLALAACKQNEADAYAAANTEEPTEMPAAATAAPDFGNVNPVSTEGDDRTQIAAFAAANGLDNVQFTPEGVGYVIVNPGDAAHPTVQDAVTIHYKGYLVDGKVFDQTQGQPVTFGLSQLIKAWQVTIPMIGRGGHIKLFAPPAMAYGQSPPPGTGITDKTILVFDVALVDF